MWHFRMFWRLFLVFALLLVLSVGLLGWVILTRVEKLSLQQIEENLRDKASFVREAVRDIGGSSALLDERVLALSQKTTTRITIIDLDGTVLADSDKDHRQMENHADRPEVQMSKREGFGTATRFSATVNKWMMYAALGVRRDGKQVAFVRVALPLDTVHEHLAELHRIVWTAASVMALAAMLLAFLLARRITRPLQELTAGAERIASGNYGHKVYIASTDEVGLLAKTFNHMSSRLAAQFAQMEEDRHQLRAILSGMIEGVVALDSAQQILFVNDRAAQLLQFPATSSVGRKLWEVVRQPALQEVVRRALAAPEAHHEELKLTGPGARNLTVHAAQLDGTPDRGIMLVLHDTTELRRLERLRQEFVANVSHELKTPLSVIKACTETLLDGAVDDPQHRGPFLERIGEQAERLHSLILDLLSLARIESEAEVFDLQEVALGLTVAACLQRHRARAEAKDQRLEALSPAAGAPATAGADTSPTFADPHAAGDEVLAWADGEAVEQILENLVDNALKYTPAGGRITVRWGASNGDAFLEVEDSGIGIAASEIPRIFERFYRVDKARARELGGTGLGLSIVKHLVQAMKGRLEATSTPGKGTKFTVRLPCAAAAPS
jgi:two-component system phosphate regulon sensor histidine kinase PhoR